ILIREGRTQYQAVGANPDLAFASLVNTCRAAGGNHLLYYYQKAIPNPRVGVRVGVEFWRHHFGPRFAVGARMPRTIEVVNMSAANKAASCVPYAVPRPPVVAGGPTMLGPGGEILSTPVAPTVVPPLADPGFIGGMQ